MESKKGILKKCVGIAIVTMLMISFIGVRCPANGSDPTIGEDGSIVLDFSFEEPVIKSAEIQNEDYARVKMPGLLMYDDPGKPRLPIKPVRVLLPQKTRVKSIEITTKSETFMGSGYLIEPGIKSIPGNFSTSSSPSLNAEIYNSSDPFPGKLYTKIGVYEFRGYSILFVNLHPVQYIPETGEVYYYQEMKLTIRLRESSSINQLFRGLPRDKARVREMVDNPEMADTYIEMPSRSPTILDANETYEYVIITTENFTDEFQPLKEDKIAKGLNATIVTVEWIYENYTGEDEADTVRKFINDSYCNWDTDYVLLGGDWDKENGSLDGDQIVPLRYLWNKTYGEALGDPIVEADIPSDLYFACLDGTFDANGNGTYGEPDDEVDLLAEVYIGRAPVDCEQEVSNFVNKTLAYVNDPYIDPDDNRPYLNTSLMLGENLYAKVWGMDHKEEIRNGCDRGGYTTVGFNATDYDVDTLYDNVSKWKAADLINEINDGIPPNLINHMGHGNWNHFMKLYNYKNKWWEPYPNTHYLHNDEYFFVYSQACIAGSFDNMEGGQEDDTSTWTPHPDKDCVAENLTVEMPYGAFAVIANSRFGFFNETTTNGSSQHFDREFFDALFGEDIRQLGPALQDAKEENIPFIDLPSYRWCYYEINLLGDPEISIRPFPAAKFTHSPQEPYIYKMVTFNASSSYDPDGEIVNYTWDFGDGNISYGEITNHTYFEPGSYEVNLTVTDNDSLGDFKVHAILIKNHPPNTPSNPDSSNGEDSVDTDTDLSWDGGDEDSLDTVTYDIYFGTSSPPPYIDTASYPANQTRITYDLEILDPGTKYYWRIKAKDNHGAQTIGPIWNFITEGPPYIPSNPNPSNGETDVPINQKLYWDGGDPNPSETVTYKVFFDKNPFPPHVATFSRSATEERISYDPGTLNPMTTYYWHISAIDDHGQTINGPPNWNFTTGSEVNHPPEKPSKPSGPTTGYRGETYTYTTSTTDQDEGDQIKYYFDWGDETGTWTGYYNSGQTAHASHSWDSVDTYNVTVKAQDEHEVESDWSDTLSVQIKNRPPYTPSDPDPYDGKTGVEWPDLTLGWCGGDPDPGDTVRYDIYFGTSEDLPDLPCIGNITKDSDVTWITYDVHNLSRLTTYYWKIIAKDNHNGTTEGPLWQFTTKLFKNNNA